ncbi:sulfotransferase domain-containing protein [Rhodovulum steppense]|uniref:Sulfotransferase domain-containing protein n=1 Tax=Rhodovulum steppense TaxID=540251 RepID=A0A4R1YMQ5_9RHOB|nr:sulfotransferase domain-containing protein [Rhodovulum steppense]TCM78962.1 sulfotransferase domain-containing protein [Rhodovulum steppense]
MRLPDFFIIGAAKAGTTTLHAMLDRHPGIFMSHRKEPEFFARDELYEKGLSEYARHFENALPNQLVGEASTIYSLSPLFPHTASRIARHIPDAKIIYVMREPVSRAYSYYLQIIKNYQNVTRDMRVNRRFEEFVISERHASAAPRELVFSSTNSHLPDVPDLCLAGSDYVRQIDAYLEHFPRSQMLFLLFEEFSANPSSVVRKITDFLGMAPLDEQILRDDALVRNVSNRHFEDLEAARSLSKLRDKLGFLWPARKALPKNMRAPLIRLLCQSNERGSMPLPMEPGTRDMLYSQYRSQFQRLSVLTGLDFSPWVKVSDEAE